MENTEQLIKMMAELKGGPPEDLDAWIETAKQSHPLLLKLAETGGAGELDLDDLRIALRLQLRRGILYDSAEEWAEKRTALVDAIVEAVNAERDSKVWLRLLPDSLAGREAKQIVGRLSIDQINRVLFPAVETETNLHPADKLMDWYSAILERSGRYESQILNRLAYFYLWYGEDSCDEEEAASYFRDMERRGITRKNPYRGTFGERGHDEMIRQILNGAADSERFRLLTEYAGKQLSEIVERGMNGSIERSAQDIGNVWYAWIEDPVCRDLRESMRRIYDALLAQPSEQDLILFDSFFKSYGAALRSVMGKAHAHPERSELAHGAAFLLALLFHYDNWLLRIIDLEGGDIESWLTEIEPLCGKDFVIGEELLVLNSLQENLICDFEARGDKENMKLLLERQVYGADALAALPGLVAEIDTTYYGQPYSTHNAIALLRIYKEDGDDAKAEQLIRDIGETEQRLSDQMREDAPCEELELLQKKYAVLLHGEELSGQEKPEAPDSAEESPEKKGFRCLSIVSGYVIAYARTHAEQQALEQTFRPAPPKLRGDFIQYLYSHPDGRDWFGMTAEERSKLFEGGDISEEE